MGQHSSWVVSAVNSAHYSLGRCLQWKSLLPLAPVLFQTKLVGGGTDEGYRFGSLMDLGSILQPVGFELVTL